MRSIKYGIIFFTVCVFAWYGCKDKWNDHYNLQDAQFNTNLLEKIKSTPEIIDFYNFLTKTGYDKILASSESYTVWAPTNEALAGLDESVKNDDAKLAQFVANHICYLSYYFNYSSAESSLRVKTLSGKHVTINKQGTTIEGAGLVSPYDRSCSNGVLHVIDKVIAPKLNIWEYLMNSDPGLKQIAFLKSLDKLVFDEGNSKKVSVNQNGQTVYDSVWVNSNVYLTNVADLNDEENVYTYILLTNNAFNGGFNTIRPYTVMSDSLKTDSLASFFNCSDLAFPGLYQYISSPMTSTTGINVSISDEDVVGTAELSNGRVITMSYHPIKLTDKVKPIIIEGENATGRRLSASTDFRNIVNRYDSEASGSYNFVYNVGSTKALWAQYTANNILSAKYKLYWVAPGYSYNAKNSITTTANKVDTIVNNFNQSLALRSYSADTVIVSFPQVLTKDYSEVLLGEYTFGKYTSALSLRVNGVTIKATTVPAASSPSTTVFATPVSIDYIKMVPVIQ
jgi:uncharacterized surface protein with fasciclin (FAS1) repeats